MSVGEPEDLNDPFIAHFHREPVSGGGIRVILLTEQPAEAATACVAPLIASLEASGRTVELRVVPIERSAPRLNEAIEGALEDATLPLVLLTTAVEAWTPAHVEPLLA